ncbi:Hypothetical predicted protein [Lecanosticta acicola]|uniref:Ecp2 effector protein-like domain-containing protein n=1 Tax=Lecanosticta acicola TaxID=111012 RepID=A0AAI8Z8K3_9PEZI|nr:Hypothetical predicted protein [Lecanosticta acicola]
MHSASVQVTIALLPALGAATRFLAGGADQAAMLYSAGSGQNEQSANPDYHHNAGNANGVNDCGVSSFVGLSLPSTSQADVNDCYAMLQKIQQDEEWTLSQEGVVAINGQDNPNVSPIIVQEGSCTFSAVVSRDGQNDNLRAALGNADVIDLVSDSIKKYAVNGKVGCQGGFNQYSVASAGAMPCDNPNYRQGDQVNVDWTLAASAPDAQELNNADVGSFPGQLSGGGSY